MLITIEGVYRNGKVELVELPSELNENTAVIVTFLPKRRINLQARGISEAEAADLRVRLMSFAEEWESPEMEQYDNYDQLKTSL